MATIMPVSIPIQTYMHPQCTLDADLDTLYAHPVHICYRLKHTKCTLLGMHTNGGDVVHLCRLNTVIAVPGTGHQQTQYLK
jgi:hypothetical protein